MPPTDSNIDNKNSNSRGTSPRSSSEILIGVVGPCSSGKTTLINGLKEYGYVARHIAQEHSYVPTMWKQITNPDMLIYLDVSFEVSQNRRKLDWTISHFDDQIKRLSNARENADLIINTDGKSISEVLDQTVQYLNSTI
ncbi:MAG: hypothetical protein ACK2TS_04945 [Anaerolineales bacterium]